MAALSSRWWLVPQRVQVQCRFHLMSCTCLQAWQVLEEGYQRSATMSREPYQAPQLSQRRFEGPRVRHPLNHLPVEFGDRGEDSHAHVHSDP
jgi:hypothetical protein